MIAIPLEPFTDDEEAALSERLNAMDAVTLGHYVETAKQSLLNKALDKSWRPRIELGLSRAEAVQLTQSLAPPPVVVEPPPVVEKAAKATKASKAKPIEA
ncbi:MAG: hypothetical protein ABIV63_20505 [Caldimonas sp.]